MKSRPAIQRLARCTSGAAAIEFAMVGILVISLVLGVFEFGRVLFARSQLAWAADVATRQVLINPPKTSQDLEKLSITIRNLLPDGSETAVRLNLPGADLVMRFTLEQDLKLFLPGFPDANIAIRIERKVPMAGY